MTVEKDWKRICVWLKKSVPAALKNHREPAGDEAIAACEGEIGIEFPESLREFYRLHDGEEEDEDSCSFDNCQRILPLDELAVQNKMSVADAEDENPTFAEWRVNIEDEMIAISGSVKALVHSPGWIQFTESPLWADRSVHRCIDFDPAPGGVAGQVIEIDQFEDHFQVIAESFEDYLKSYADDLDAGRYKVEDQRINDTQQHDPASWGVPEYLAGSTMADGSAYAARTSPTAEEISVDDPVTLSGEIGMLFGPTAGSDEVEFQFIHDDGRRYLVFASKSQTDGYKRVFKGGSIALVATRFVDPDGKNDDNTPNLLARSISGSRGAPRAESSRTAKETTAIALKFANAIADGKLDDAHEMLTSKLAKRTKPAALGAEYQALADDMGGVTGVGPADEILREWPDQGDKDVAMVYVTLAGDEWSEAITVTLTEVKGELLISDLEWGRP